METTVKLPVTATLKGLQIGDKVVFPIEQSNTVRATASKLRKEFSRISWAVQIDDNTEEYTTTVVRLQ